MCITEDKLVESYGKATPVNGILFFIAGKSTCRLHEDSWTEDMLNILEKITDPAMRALAMKQLKCIAEL